MNVRLITYAAVLAVTFGAGWAANGWRLSTKLVEQQNDTLTQAVKDRDNALELTNDKLDEVLTKVGAAAANANATNEALSKLNTRHLAVVEGITARTQSINNEIRKLDPPKCEFSLEYGGMYRQIGEAANSARGSLYRTDDK